MAVLKLGVVGLGAIAEYVHLPTLTQIPGVHIAAVAESDPERLIRVGQKVGAGFLLSHYDQILDLPDIDAVLICLPNALHAEVAIAAMQKGKHVYLEKPIAVSLNEAQQVLTAWKQTGMVGMIGFNYRFNPFYCQAKQQLQSGVLGKLIAVRTVFALSPRNLPDWKHQRASGGGVLLDLASHHIDLVRFLFEQEIYEVFAQIQSHQTEHDTATLTMRLQNGLAVESFFSFCAAEEDRVEIYGLKAKVTIDRYRRLEVQFHDPTFINPRLKQIKRGLNLLKQSPQYLKKMLSAGVEPSYRGALEHFISAVRSKRPASPDFLDGYRSLAVIIAAEQSAATGRTSSITDFLNQQSEFHAQQK